MIKSLTLGILLALFYPSQRLSADEFEDSGPGGHNWVDRTEENSLPMVNQTPENPVPPVNRLPSSARLNSNHAQDSELQPFKDIFNLSQENTKSTLEEKLAEQNDTSAELEKALEILKSEDTLEQSLRVLSTEDQLDDLRAAYESALRNRANYKSGHTLHVGDLTTDQMVDCHHLYELGQKKIFETKDFIRANILKQDPQISAEDLDAKIELRFAELVNKNHISDNNEHGRVEVNALKNKGQIFYFLRVVHRESGKSVMYSDASHYVQEMKHFRKWVARQFFEANRDVVHFGIDGQIPVSADHYKSPDMVAGGFPTMRSMFSSHYWMNWIRAWKSFEPADSVVSAVCTAGEVGLWMCFDQGNVEFLVYKIKIAFGLIVGSLTTPIQNIVKLKGRLTPLIIDKLYGSVKRSWISLLYGVMITSTTHPDGVAALADPYVMFLMATNMYISNFVKDEGQRIVESFADLRTFSGDWIIPLPFIEDGMKMRGKIIETSSLQAMRVLTGYLRYIDMRLFDWTTQMLPLPAAVNIAISRAAYVSLALVPMYINLRTLQHFRNVAKARFDENPTPEHEGKLNQIEEVLDAQRQRWKGLGLALYNIFVKTPKKLVFSPVTLFKELRSKVSNWYTSLWKAKVEAEEDNKGEHEFDEEKFIAELPSHSNETVDHCEKSFLKGS